MVELSNDRGLRAPAVRDETRVALLEATGRLIQRFGYKKTSVEEIAQEAGVSRATAYIYFASKEALVLAWVEWRGQRRVENLRALAREASPGWSVRDRAAAVLLARVLIAYDEAIPYLGTTAGIQGVDELRVALGARLLEQRERQHEADQQVIAELLESGTQLAEFAPTLDSRWHARLLVLGTNALMPANLLPGLLADRAKIEAAARALIELMLNGLPTGRETASR